MVLPATSGVGSYKNPELVLEALQAPSLSAIQLVISGIALNSVLMNLFSIHLLWKGEFCR